MTACTRSSVLPIIEEYLLATGMPLAAFGRAAAYNPWFVADLRAGALLTEPDAHHVLDYIEESMERRLGIASTTAQLSSPCTVRALR